VLYEIDKRVSVPGRQFKQIFKTDEVIQDIIYDTGFSFCGSLGEIQSDDSPPLLSWFKSQPYASPSLDQRDSRLPTLDIMPPIYGIGYKL